MTLPGPGDPATWGPFNGHPNDPRHPGDDDCPDCGEVMLAHDGCCGCGWAPPDPPYDVWLDDDR